MTSRTYHICHSFGFAFAASALVGLSWAGGARAEEFCVSCSEPFAMYRCAINDNGALVAPAGAQLPCIKELARQGGHKSCSVQRDTGVECVGKLLVIAPDPAMAIPQHHPINARSGPAAPDEADVAVEAEENDKANVEDPRDALPEGQPKTVEELAKRTAKSSKEGLDTAGKAVSDVAKSTGGQIKNAGDYVGTTAKKTWDCIASLFSKCGE